jgi:hypothetical protein
MSEENPKQDHKELNSRDSILMDALLRHSLQPKDIQDQLRVKKLVESLREESLRPKLERPEISKGPIRRWFPVSLVAAALIAIAFVIQLGSSQSTALAAVDRSIVAEERNFAREYEVTLVARGAMRLNRTSTHKLFVRQRDFAICSIPRLGNGEVWIGGQGSERWVVPRFGPVLVGQEDLFNRHLPNSTILETPFLSVTTILERIRRGYDLQLVAGVPLVEGETTVMCDKIVGTRIRQFPIAAPQNVELWADQESGFARRIELKWGNDNSDSRWLEASAQLMGTPDLPEDFFDHSGHHSADRAVERVSK